MSFKGGIKIWDLIRIMVNKRKNGGKWEEKIGRRLADESS